MPKRKSKEKTLEAKKTREEKLSEDEKKKKEKKALKEGKLEKPLDEKVEEKIEEEVGKIVETEIGEKEKGEMKKVEIEVEKKEEKKILDISAGIQIAKGRRGEFILWKPVTELGKLVASGAITSIDEVLDSGKKILLMSTTRASISLSA